MQAVPLRPGGCASLQPVLFPQSLPLAFWTASATFSPPSVGRGGGKRESYTEPSIRHAKPVQKPEIQLSWTAVICGLELSFPQAHNRLEAVSLRRGEAMPGLAVAALPQQGTAEMVLP